MNPSRTFGPLLWMQWRTSKWVVFAILPLCFGLPILAVRFAQRVAGGAYADPALDTLGVLQVWSPVFPILAAFTGAALALAAWIWDHNTHHVYALTLPVERWMYALQKLTAGLLLLAIPAVAVLAGSIAATSGSIPEGLHAYPFSFTLRFLFAALITFAVMFAFAAGTVRTTVRVIIAVAVIFVLGSVLVGVASDSLDLGWPTPFELLVSAMRSWAGPFHVFGGNWMLIDV
jgi:hypothetical protein